ncbi:MAG: nucleoside deaminase [Marinifilaceae bacterium]
MSIVFDDEYYMKLALREAERAADMGEIPVGAIVVCRGHIVARSHNMTERLNDVTAHAELLAITAASEARGGKYLTDCTLYVTLEPCVMCAGALAWSQLGRLVFGAGDEQRGFSRLSPPVLHKRTEVISGILAEECGEIVKRFFKSKR